MSQKQAIRALLTGLTVFLTGIAVYKGVPTSLDMVYQPFIQGLVAGLASLPINIGTRTKVKGPPA